MNTKKLFGYGLFAVILALSLIGCPVETEEDGSKTLSGDIEIHAGNTKVADVFVNTELTANYSGDEAVTLSYQWKKGTGNVGTNSNKFTPTEAGSYTVTVSAPGYNPKTSEPVDVASLNALSEDITITPAGPVETGTELTAEYDGDEDVSYQWNNDSGPILGATSDTYTPDQAGSYTVTVSAPGYNPKTSDPVIVIVIVNGTIIVPGDDLAEKLTWVTTETNIQDGKTYLITIDTDEEVPPTTLSYTDLADVTIIIKGAAAETTITLSENGSLFTIEDGVTLILEENITLEGIGTNNTSLIRVNADGVFKMKTGTKITGNTIITVPQYTEEVINCSGGGVLVAANGIFIMEGGEISGNVTGAWSNGGGVYVAGTFTMSDGKISDNSFANGGSGGGVYVAANGTFTMDSGEISGNTALNCGGVYVAANGTFTMNSGKISGNTVNSNTYGGGGVYVQNNGTFTMTGGEITGNDGGGYGGGVQVSGGGTFTMDSGKISGNTANSGGGVHTGGNFTMNDGEISGNTANFNGGGVYVIAGTFIMKGGEIFDNTASSSNSNGGYGGGVFMYQTNNPAFRLVTGTIYGSDAEEGKANTATAARGAAFYDEYSSDTDRRQYGTLDTDGKWVKAGNLAAIEENTIKVENGVLEP